MVYSKSHSRVLHFFGDHCSMEIALLLLLTVSVTAASPIKPTHRTQPETFPPGANVQELEVKRSEGTKEVGHVPELKIIPFHSEDKQQDMEALKNRLAVKTRPRRAPQRGCQLGTCQLHILANKLYQIGQTSGKDESTRAQDPQGYGR